MFDPIPLLKIAPIFAVALALPGPDFFMISSLSLSRGRGAGFWASCGIAAGNLTWATLCVWGFAAIFAKVSGLLLVVRLCGGAYLLYLAYGLLKSSLAPIDETQDINKTTANITRKRHPLVIGLTTNITNPKALAFFTSIFAVAMPAVASTTTQIAMLALIIVMSVAWFGFVSFCLSTPAMRTVYMRWSRWIDRVAGACLALFGIRLLSSSLKN